MLRILLPLLLVPVVCSAQYPVACYPFNNGTGSDVTLNGFDGAVMGATPIADRLGVPNSALDFNGTSDRVQLPPFGNMIPTDEFSVSFWLKAEGSNSDAAIMTQPDDAYDRLCISPHYNHSGGNTVFWDYGNIFDDGRSSIDPYPLSTDWAHWVFVHSAEQNRMSIYVDGVLADEELHHSAIVDRTKPVWIGGGMATGGADFFFHGGIDDVQFYSSALSGTAVALLYASQITGWTCSLVGISEADATTPVRASWTGNAVVVEWPDAAHAGDLSLVDAEGRTVGSGTAMSGSRWQLPVNNLAPGLYTVRCVVKGLVTVGKLMVQ